MRLIKDDSMGGYRTKNGEYELRKEFTWGGSKRMHKVYKLYYGGNYMGMPESVKQANEWIKRHEEEQA